MTSLPTKDSLGFGRSALFPKLCGRGDEVLWSGRLTKINSYKMHQEREFVVTKRLVINLGSQKGFFGFLSSGFRRIIPIEKIRFITYSNTSNNFILHVPDEFDYFLSSRDRPDILRAILSAAVALSAPPIQFYIVEEINLYRYNRYEGQKKKGQRPKFPAVTRVDVTLDDFEALLKARIEESQSTLDGRVTWASHFPGRLSIDSFVLLKQIGRGNLAKIFLAERKDTRQLVVLKAVSKMDVIKRNFFQYLKSERRVMETVTSPFLLKMEHCFASPTHVFFVLEFRQGGELFHHLRRAARFSEATAKFYGAQVLTALIELHSRNVIYRDVKPENVFLDAQGNACLANFGISKIVDPRSSTRSFIGTPAYMAPEVVREREYNRAVDIWGFGVLLYEFVYGLPPFFSKNQSITMNFILNFEPVFLKEFPISEELKDLISQVG